MTRFNYLLRQYENLSAVASIFSALSGRPTSDWIADQRVSDQFLEQRNAIERGELGAARQGLGEIQLKLQETQEKLQQFDNSLSAYLLRARYQQQGARREEIKELLQFLLGKSPLQEGDYDKIDYLATRFYALNCGAGSDLTGGFEDRIRTEYRQMLTRAGLIVQDAPNNAVMERYKFFREEIESLKTFEQLTTQDVIGRLREFKAGLKNHWFHPDVLIETARTNLLVGECFQKLANNERQQIDRLATQLLSAGISEVRQPVGTGTIPVEDAQEISALSASLLDQEYRTNKERLARIAKIRELLEQAHDSITTASEQENLPSPDSLACGVQPKELETILDELSPTPDRLQQDLRARISHISRLVSESAAPGVEVNIELGNSTLTITPWEGKAFHPDQSQLPPEETRLRRLLRVSVALIAELQEKADFVCRGLELERLRNTYLIGARYLIQLSQQTVREIELCCVNAHSSFPRKICEQLLITRQKLIESCKQFSARVRTAAGKTEGI
jgi:tetratricopeptide (TPR) repeat protein